MSSTDQWRRATPNRSAWVMPPAVALAVYGVTTLALGWFFLFTTTGQLVDQHALLGGQMYAESGGGTLVGRGLALFASLTNRTVGLISPLFVGVVVLALVGIALWRRQVWLGLAALAAFVGANLTTQATKAWLARPDFDLYWAYGNSLPSGHTTIAASASFSFLLLTVARWRWLVAVVGATFTTFVALATYMQGWHRPSDTVAAVCVSAVWYVLVETIRRMLVPPPFEGKVEYRRTVRVLDVLAGICAALGIGILAAVALTMPEQLEGADDALQRLAFMGAFFGIPAVSIGTSRILLAIGPREAEPQR